MPTKETTTFRIDEAGKVQPRSRAEWLLKTWLPRTLDLFSDGRVEIIVRRPTRSLGQNRYYWGYVIRPIRKALADAGYTLSDKALHEHFKEVFLGVESSYEYVDKKTGEVHEVTETRSTTELDSTQFDRYVERIRHSELVRQLGVYLPRPDDPDEVFQEIDGR